MKYQTWKDIKLATLQKMFASNGTTIQKDSSNTEYINSMPQACNEALQLLSTAGKFLIGTYQIIVSPIDNLISDSAAEQTYNIVDDSISFEAKGAKSYYFKASGLIDVHITVGGVEKIALTVEESGFKAYKGLIPNDDSEDVVITFHSVYPSNVTNIALYAATFPNDADVTPYEEYIRYDLPELIDDFYQLESGQIYYEGEIAPRYIAADQYYQESNKVLVLKRSMPGIYTIYYKKYPQMITLDTPDEYEIHLDPEVVTLVPLYMASQLYKDDDNAIATVYRNEFETAFERLTKAANVPRKEEFTSESGWC